MYAHKRNWKHLRLLFSSLKKLAIAPDPATGSQPPCTGFWLSLSLFIPLYYGLIILLYSAQTPYLIQDDARQHVVWLQRFIDPQLFSHDLIAHYFQSVDPAGFKFFYWLWAHFGVEPLILAKWLPLLLGLITSAYFFLSYLQILPIPASAFLATLLFNQTIWLKDDVVSATPRAFAYPIFAAFLYYLLQQSVIPCLVAIALQGLFFPQLLFVQLAILTIRLIRWQKGRFRFTPQKNSYVTWLLGFTVAIVVLSPFIFNLSEFGTAVTANQMQRMPEFGLGGRSQYFGVNPIKFAFGGASGLRAPLFPPLLWMSLGLPLVLKGRSSPGRLITPKIQIVWQIIFASLGVFALAHLLLFKLYFPSRYTYHSLRFVMPMAAAIVLTTLLSSSWHWFQQQRRSKAKFNLQQRTTLGLVLLLAIASLIVPALPPIFLKPELWVVGQYPKTYSFLSDQPKTILIASLTEEVNNLPAFSHRSILTGGEFAFAYHPAYYNQFKQQTIDVIRAYYSPDLAEVKQIIQQYGINFFLLETDSFQPEFLLNKEWLVHSSLQSTVFEAVAQLRQGRKPALRKLRRRCSVLSESGLTVIDTDCIMNQS
jgi:hypothetical protein